jgi:hypothetical protein
LQWLQAGFCFMVSFTFLPIIVRTAISFLCLSEACLGKKRSILLVAACACLSQVIRPQKFALMFSLGSICSMGAIGTQQQQRPPAYL